MSAFRWILALPAGAAAYAALNYVFNSVSPLAVMPFSCIGTPMTQIIETSFCSYYFVYCGANVAPKKRIYVALVLSSILILTGEALVFLIDTVPQTSYETVYGWMCDILEGGRLGTFDLRENFRETTLPFLLIVRIVSCFSALFRIYCREKIDCKPTVPANGFTYVYRSALIVSKILCWYGGAELFVLYLSEVSYAENPLADYSLTHLFVEAFNPLHLVVIFLFITPRSMPLFQHLYILITAGFIGLLVFSRLLASFTGRQAKT